jgi:UDP-N-acetylmuramate dehydrogenase
MPPGAVQDFNAAAHRKALLMLAMNPKSHEASLVQELQAISELRVRVSEPLARYTSMKVGGPADYFIDVESEPALAQLLRLLSLRAMPFHLLGNGSNVLISDLGVEGVLIHLVGAFKNAEWHEQGNESWVEAGAGQAVTQLVRQAARRGYGGLEFAEGIPGSVGGALVMNAGAYGSEFEKVVVAVYGMTRQGTPIQFDREQMRFTYRDSHLAPGTVVTRVRLSVHRQESSRVSIKVRELVTKRKSSQPSGYPNSGSMFRNPPGDYAGRLVEAAGLKGKQIGNFIVNLGGASAEDVRRLMELARAEVQAKFGVILNPEVKLIGRWPSVRVE